MEKTVAFQRGLKSRHVSLIALGGIIGSSYFLGTGYVLNQIGPSAFLAYALGGLITYLTMACLAELTIAIPRPGSFVSYGAELISPTWACGIGWSYWISWVVYVHSECIAAGILMHGFLPELGVFSWALIFGAIIIAINLLNVAVFGETEFFLALIKIALLVGFSIFAILIFFGIIGNSKPIGAEYLLHQGGLFPNGSIIFLVNMVILLANFQGSEIIGLSASESEHPEKNIPRALKKIVIRIVGLYLIPTFLLVLIFPWNQAGLSGSIFAQALQRYGFTPIAHVFNFLIIAGAISCANSGLYATVRSLHALSLRGIGPKGLTKLNQNGIPMRATFITMAAILGLLSISHFFSAYSLYAHLLAISGFTGAICWISICWSQLRFRKLWRMGHYPMASLGYRIVLFPYLTHFAIWLQVGCLLMLFINPTLRASIYFGAPAFILPMLIYKLASRRAVKSGS